MFANLDMLIYAGNLENLRDVGGSPNYRFVRGDTPESSYRTYLELVLREQL